jgi:hypothetical protein
MPSSRIVAVDLLTSSYRIVGDLKISNSGILGACADLNRSYLELNKASLARIHMATKLAESAHTIRVIKQQIMAVCLSRREDVGVSTGLRGGYSRPYQYPLRITTSIYELEGTYEWAGRFDLSVIMDGTCDFIPMYDASLGAILFPSLLIQNSVILFNRRHMDTLIVMNESA